MLSHFRYLRVPSLSILEWALTQQSTFCQTAHVKIPLPATCQLQKTDGWFTLSLLASSGMQPRNLTISADTTQLCSSSVCWPSQYKPSGLNVQTHCISWLYAGLFWKIFAPIIVKVPTILFHVYFCPAVIKIWFQKSSNFLIHLANIVQKFSGHLSKIISWYGLFAH